MDAQDVLLKFKSEVNDILKQGQKGETSKHFTRHPQTYLQIASKQIFLPIILIFVVTGILYYLFEPTIDSTDRYKSVWTVCFESYKILMGAFTVFIVTIFLTNRRQQRAYSFEMIKELNSKEFLEVRNNLSNQMRQAVNGNKDIDDLESWFPYNDGYIEFVVHRMKPYVEYPLSEFTKEHALSNMLYFILRLSNYYKFDMLNVRLTRHLFHFFFCHYEIIMLGFASGLKKHRKFLNNKGFAYDERWDLVSQDIEEFFKIIGLTCKLDTNHIYIYFPSLNSVSQIN